MARRAVDKYGDHPFEPTYDESHFRALLSTFCAAGCLHRAESISGPTFFRLSPKFNQSLADLTDYRSLRLEQLKSVQIVLDYDIYEYSYDRYENIKKAMRQLLSAPLLTTLDFKFDMEHLYFPTTGEETPELQELMAPRHTWEFLSSLSLHGIVMDMEVTKAMLLRHKGSLRVLQLENCIVYDQNRGKKAQNEPIIDLCHFLHSSMTMTEVRFCGRFRSNSIWWELIDEDQPPTERNFGCQLGSYAANKGPLPTGLDDMDSWRVTLKEYVDAREVNGSLPGHPWQLNMLPNDCGWWMNIDDFYSGW